MREKHKKKSSFGSHSFEILSITAIDPFPEIKFMQKFIPLSNSPANENASHLPALNISENKASVLDGGSLYLADHALTSSEFTIFDSKSRDIKNSC